MKNLWNVLCETGEEDFLSPFETVKDKRKSIYRYLRNLYRCWDFMFVPDDPIPEHIRWAFTINQKNEMYSFHISFPAEHIFLDVRNKKYLLLENWYGEDITSIIDEEIAKAIKSIDSDWHTEKHILQAKYNYLLNLKINNQYLIPYKDITDLSLVFN